MSDQVVARVLGVQAEVNVAFEASTLEFEHLYVSAFPRVYSFIRSQVGSVQSAQDVVGRIFLKAYKHHSKAPAGPAVVGATAIARAHGRWPCKRSRRRRA